VSHGAPGWSGHSVPALMPQCGAAPGSAAHNHTWQMTTSTATAPGAFAAARARPQWRQRPWWPLSQLGVTVTGQITIANGGAPA
jgi:hypothetical protein